MLLTPFAARFALALLAALALFTAPARADDELEQAKAHFKKGQVHYSLGEFAQAADEYREAYRLRSQPGILFNIGQAMRLLGRPRDAVFYYKQYLAQKPEAPNRVEVEAIIADLKARLDAAGDKGDRDEPPSLPPSTGMTADSDDVSGPAPAARAPELNAAAGARAVPAAALASPSDASSGNGTAHVVGYSAAAAGALLEVGAYIFYSSAKSAADQLSQKYASHSLQPSDSQLKSTVDSKGKLATLSAIGGAALLAGGAALVFAF